MNRGAYRGTFWIGILACTLTMAGAIMASSLSQNLPDVRGAWDGFYLAADGATGPFTFDVTLQDFRRFEGNGLLQFVENSSLPYQFNATMPGPDFITGTGVTSTGRMTFQADLQAFAGLGGDADVMSAQYHFVPSKGGNSPVDALLLHPFPGVATPDISGSGQGPFVSLPDPNVRRDVSDLNFQGVGRIQLAPRSARGTFVGRVEFFRDLNQAPVFSWPLLATASDDGNVVMIGQGAAGRIVYNGGLMPPQDPESPSPLWGFFRLQFTDGRSQFGAINFNLSK